MKLEVEYERYEEKPRMIDRIIESLKNSDKSMQIFLIDYSNVNLQLENGTVKIKVEKQSFLSNKNNPTEIIKSQTYIFEENTQIVKTYWKVNRICFTEDFNYIKKFDEDVSTECFWKKDFESIFQDNNYFYKAFEEIFYPELDLKKE